MTHGIAVCDTSSPSLETTIFSKAVSYMQSGDLTAALDLLMKSEMGRFKIHGLKMLLRQNGVHQYDALIHEFISINKDIILDDRGLWHAFSEISARLGYSSDANAAQAYAFALNDQWEQAEGALSQAILNPGNGHLGVQFMLNSRNRFDQRYQTKSYR